MRLPRFRTRTMMAAVAVLAVVLTTGIEVRRLLSLSRFYEEQAYHHYAAENSDIVDVVIDGKHLPQAELDRINRRSVPWNATMRRKYEYAVWHPWVQVTHELPDPFEGYSRPQMVNAVTKKGVRIPAPKF